jgi:Terminase large subunit, T4likevirus-type, N-terminal
MGQTIRFGEVNRAWQQDCAKIHSRFAVLALHRRAGKTELALKRLLTFAFLDKQPLPNYLYVAPYLKQARIIAWSRLKQMVQPIQDIVDVYESGPYLRFLHNGAIVRLLGADNPDSIRGMRLDGVVLDEVAQMKPEIWEEIIQPALSDRLGWAWFIGTPNGINLFSQLYARSTERSTGKKDDWMRARYTVYDTQTVDIQEVERLRNAMSQASFAREYLCDFSAAGDDQLLSITDIEESAHKKHPDSAVYLSPLVLGVDPARFGADRSVLMFRRGLISFDPIISQGLDNMALAGKIAGEIERMQPDAVFIDAGGGAGVIDRLRQLSYSVIEVNFGAKACNPQYVNKRTEMWFEMKLWLESGGAIPNDESLKHELATPTYKYNAGNQKVLESKDEIKRRLNSSSPDIADALALTFAYPVARKKFEDGLIPSRPKVYSPFE